MAENEADERLGMAFPLIYRHFSPIFLPTAREFHATSLHGKLRQVVTLRRSRAATREDFEIPTIPPGPLFKRAGEGAGALPGVGTLGSRSKLTHKPAYSLTPMAWARACPEAQRIGRQWRALAR